MYQQEQGRSQSHSSRKRSYSDSELKHGVGTLSAPTRPKLNKGNDLGETDTILLEYIEKEVNSLPKKSEIRSMDTEEKVLFNQIQDDALSDMPAENEAAVPVAKLFDDRYTAIGSGGAASCVIVLMRARDTAQKIYGGSIHLSADELETPQNASHALLHLHKEVAKLMPEEKMVDNEVYAIGGIKEENKTYAASAYKSYANLLKACKELRGKINLVGALMPISNLKNYANAFLTSTKVRYAVEELSDAESDG